MFQKKKILRKWFEIIVPWESLCCFGITKSCGLREPIYLSESQFPHPCKGDNANTYWDVVRMEQMIENSHCWEQQGILDYFYQSLVGDLLGDKHSRS